MLCHGSLKLFWDLSHTEQLMFLQSHRAGLLYQSKLTPRFLSHLPSLKTGQHKFRNTPISSHALWNYAKASMTCTMFPGWMLMQIFSLGRSSWYRGKQDEMTHRLGNMPSPNATWLLHNAQCDGHWFHIFAHFKGCVLKKSHSEVYHKCSPFVENEWVLKLPVSRAGLNKDACTHLYPLLCKPEVMSYTWLLWKNKVQSKNAFPTGYSFTFCKYFWLRDGSMNYYFPTALNKGVMDL